MKTKNPELPPNTYFLQDTPDGGVDIMYVAPCGDHWHVANISQQELRTVNPGVKWTHPIIGMNGIIQIGKLLEGLKAQKRN